MNYVLSNLRKEKAETNKNISHCKYILKIEGQDLMTVAIYGRQLRKSKKYLSQLEKAIHILKAENNFETQKDEQPQN